MKKRICKLLALALCALFLPLAVPGNARADTLYIIPDSSTRALTYSELWDYSYDTLLYAFNEIYARQGYKFEYGSRCYNWFTQMPWYTPNESESSTNHHETYSQSGGRPRDAVEFSFVSQSYHRHKINKKTLYS